MTDGFGDRASAVAARLERIYLAALRVIILVFASVCILAAGYLALDGARRALTSTIVTPAPVAVSAEEALSPVITQATADKTQDTAAAGPTSASKATHAAFLKGTFAPYHAAYRRLATAYRKPEDKILNAEELAQALGYTADVLDAYDFGDSPALQGLGLTAIRFQTDESYSKTQIDVVTKALEDPRLLKRAAQYKAAQKTAKTCSTVYQMRTVWDSNSTACSNWFYRPYGCSVRRAVPVSQCEPAYPAGIQTPLETFSRLDASYRLAWVDKTNAAEAAAAENRAARTAVKAKAPAVFLMALWVFGAFLVVMFMFLLIAVERHLRRLAQNRADISEPSETIAA